MDSPTFEVGTWMKFDETDIRIICNLQRDARTNFVDIAAEYGVNVNTVRKRFQSLRRNSVVLGTTILIGPRHLPRMPHPPRD